MNTTTATAALPRPDVLVDSRPWGSFRQYAHNEQVTVKIITVAGGEALSRQRHAHRDELWIALDEGLVVELDDVRHHTEAGEELWIPRGTVHRASAPTGRARFVEVAFGDFDEGDIERLDDRYGR